MSIPLYLVADIGGTNARFALLDQRGVRSAQLTLRVADHPDITGAIDAAMRVFAPAGRVEVAVLAVAGPVNGNEALLTNSDWHICGQALKKQFGWRDVRLCNDFEAVAYGVCQTGVTHRRIGGAEQGAGGYPCAVIGPGTGFGVANILRGPSGWQVLASEGGHGRFAPITERDVNILQLLRRKLKGVQREDLLSGRGLCNLYGVLAEIHGKEVVALADPSAITAMALRDRASFSAEVLNVFCGILGAVAADIALDLGSRGGVYIAGGMAPRFADFLVASSFRNRFEDHPVFGHYLRQIPTFLVASEEPGLLGAEYLLRQILIDDYA